MSYCSRLSDCKTEFRTLEVSFFNNLTDAMTTDSFDEIVALGPKEYTLTSSISIKRETVLHLAAKTDNIKLIAHIVTLAGLDILNVGNKDGWVPLHTACHYGKSRAALMLLKYGTPINILTKEAPKDETPLQLAAKTKDLSCLKVLLRKGAVIPETLLVKEPIPILGLNRETYAKKRVAEAERQISAENLFSTWNWNQKKKELPKPIVTLIYRYLDKSSPVFQHVRPVKTKFTYAADAPYDFGTINQTTTPDEFDQIVQSCINKYQNSEERPYQLDFRVTVWQENVLHLAAKRGNVPLIHHIVHKAGKNILNIGDHFGMTPLHYACFLEERGAARALITLGANTNAATIRKYDSSSLALWAKETTPLLITLKKPKVDLETVKMLLKFGANIPDELRYENYSLSSKLMQEHWKNMTDHLAEALKEGLPPL